MLPLYKNSSPKKSEKSNAGLWYDKFCDQWPVSTTTENWTLAAQNNTNPKLNWINTVTKKRIGESSLLEEACDRQADIVGAQSGPAPLKIKTQWHFVSGLGRQHPVENGFTWHHTLGVPYLPGSSVKGMVRNWASQWEGADPEDIKRIFGPRRDVKSTESPATGSVIFLDGLPTGSVQLKADIMTPHYGEYYADGKPPADWISPVPIPFLVVDKNQQFQFSVMVITRNEQGKQDVKQAYDWLVAALENIGAGAKTATGYGVFKQNKGSNPDPVEETWSKVTLKFSPGNKILTALRNGKTARGSSQRSGPLKVFIDGLDNDTKNQLKRNGIERDVQVEKKGDNCYALTAVLDN